MLATCGPLGPAATITRSLAPGGTNSRPIALQDVHVKERVAVAVGQLDEAVAFLLVEPFDDAGEALAALRRGRGAERRRGEFDRGVGVKPGGPWPRPMGKRFIVIEGVLARRPGIPVLIHKTQTFRSVEIKERRPSITDAASSRRTSAKPRDGAEIAPKIREFGGLADLDPVVGKRCRRRGRRHQNRRHGEPIETCRRLRRAMARAGQAKRRHGQEEKRDCQRERQPGTARGVRATT